jgi:hypothetical protein
MLRFILVNAEHSVIKHSTKMREKYSRLMRRLSRNRAIVAIARILLKTIYVMLRKDKDFIDQNGGLTERKIQIMQSRAKGPSQEKDLDDVMKEVKKFIREKRTGGESKELFSYKNLNHSHVNYDNITCSNYGKEI